MMYHLNLATLLLVWSHLCFAQTPIQDSDQIPLPAPEYSHTNEVDLKSEDVARLLNRNLKSLPARSKEKNRVEVFVLSGDYDNGITNLDLSTLGVPVDSEITDNIKKTMESEYARFLKKRKKNRAHKFGFVFSYDFDNNQVLNVSVSTYILK